MKLSERLRLLHRVWRYRLKAEKCEIALVRDVIRPGDTVVDIGAHKAAFTYWMAKAVGDRGRVLAFEPIPLLADYLRRVVELFPERIELFQCALSDTSGQATLFFPGEHLGCASLENTQTLMQDPIEVHKRTLDECLLERSLRGRVSFIKCDVEHHELSVFRGARRLLTSDRPILLFESGNLINGLSVCEPVFDELSRLGYEGHYFEGSGIRPLSAFDPSRQPASLRFGNQNFVFTHPSVVTWRSFDRPFAVDWHASEPSAKPRVSAA